MLLELRQAHVIEIVDQGAIHLTWTDRWDTAEAFPKLREIIVPLPATGADYLVCLHELGHVLAPGALELEDQEGVFANLAAEGLAWAWAASVAKPELLQPGDWDAAVICLETHFRRLPVSATTVAGSPCNTPSSTHA